MRRIILLLSLVLAPASLFAADGAGGASVGTITPIFSQLVMFALPTGFKPVFEKASGNQYIREAVLAGETTEQWTQMITVTGAKGLVANPALSAQSFAAGIVAGFKRACPDTFALTPLGALKISGSGESFVAWTSCGTVGSGASAHSESALIFAIKGAADYYTIQWAERAPPSGQPMSFDQAKWQDRVSKLSPIRICPIVPGEPAPYPSCLDRK